MNIAILGAGAFGTAMSKHLSSLGCDVLLWTIDERQSDGINKNHRNPLCFQETELQHNIRCTLDICEALDFSDRIIMALPTQVEREVCEKVARSGRKGLHMLNLSKGIEIATGALLHEIHDEVIPDFKYSALSGPSFAAEVLEEKPTTVALASRVDGEAESWQKIVSGGNFRVYTSDDVVGLEVGGSTKNIYAVAAGIADAMKLGCNAQAALICRGLAEMMRFGQRMGAKPLTLSGLAGVGDLVLTCSSTLSRNFRLGLAIGEGKKFDEAVRSLGQVAEGAYTVRAVVENSKKFDVEMPLAEGVYSVLYGGKSPQKLLQSFFARPLKAELNL